MEIEAKIIKNESLSQQDLDTLIHIKQQYWPYPYEAQTAWIKDNIHADDYHFFLKVDAVCVGYLDVVHVTVIANGEELHDYGIGNVCVDQNYTQMGLGSLLMSVVNTWIKQQNKIGFLLCKDDLVPFYKNAGWSILQADETIIGKSKYSVNTMFFNDENCRFIKPFRRIEFNKNF